MPDILTKAPRDLAEELRTLLYQAGGEILSRTDVDYGLSLLSRILKENGLPTSKNAVERDSVQSSPIPVGSATPETIRISLPALRAVVLGLIDDGRTKGQLNLPWFFYRSPSTADIAVRLDFCDELEKRLRQLPAGG